MSFMTKLMNFEGPIFNGKPKPFFSPSVMADGTSSTTHTFNGVVLGPTNKKRLVVIGVANDNVAISSISINGVNMAGIAGASSGGSIPAVAMYQLAVPDGQLANIVFTFGTASTMGASLWCVYPEDSTKVDAVAGSGTTTTNITLTDLEVRTGGVSLIFAAASTGIQTPTWNESNSIEKLFDAIYTGTKQIMAAWINPNIQHSTTGDVDIAEGSSSTRNAAAVSYVR